MDVSTRIKPEAISREALTGLLRGFVLGVIYTLWYGNTKFAQGRMSGRSAPGSNACTLVCSHASSYVPYIVTTALLFDFFAISIVPASTGLDTQYRLMAFFMPSLSCSLGLWVHIVPLACERIPYLQVLRAERRYDNRDLPNAGLTVLPFVEP